MDERELRAVVREILGAACCRDDCAEIPCGADVIVATTDMLHTETDFPPDMTDWQVGWMSAAVSLSDIASMGASPLGLLLAVGLDRPGRLRPILEGARSCASRNGCAVIGGDLDRHGELTLVSTGIGLASPPGPVRRAGARVGDLVGLVGIPGRAQAGLDGFANHRQALLEPQPLVREGILIRDSGATAMIDTSDGLLAGLSEMMEVGGTGFSIESRLIPLAGGVPVPRAMEYALTGGGDFGLLFTLPPGRHPVRGVEAQVIGEVIAERVITVDGRPVESAGYLHRWE